MKKKQALPLSIKVFLFAAVGTFLFFLIRSIPALIWDLSFFPNSTDQRELPEVSPVQSSPSSINKKEEPKQIPSFEKEQKTLSKRQKKENSKIHPVKVSKTLPEKKDTASPPQNKVLSEEEYRKSMIRKVEKGIINSYTYTITYKNGGKFKVSIFRDSQGKLNSAWTNSFGIGRITGYAGTDEYRREQQAKFDKMSPQEWEEYRRKRDPDFYKWKDNPQLAWEEVEQGGPKWGPALTFLVSQQRKKLGDLRTRVLNNLPKKEWGSGRHIHVLHTLYFHKFPVFPEELKLLEKKGYIRLDNRQEILAKDKTGDELLKELAQLQKGRDFWYAYDRIQKFPWRLRDLRQMTLNIPKESWGSDQHSSILRLLILEGQSVSADERELVKNSHQGLPDKKEIEEYTERKKEYILLRDYIIYKINGKKYYIRRKDLETLNKNSQNKNK